MMSTLFIFIEGKHDKIFVDYVLSDYLREKSVYVHPIPYAKKSQSRINKEIKSKSNNYLFLSDLDSNSSPCITSKKELRASKYNNLDFDKIIIVKEEIESWFLAGIDSKIDQFKNFIVPNNTDSITKEIFDDMLKKNSIENKNSFLIEVGKNFNIKLATQRNTSFKYFLNKINSIYLN